jgi:succinyl-CoA synthetase beta subunit
MVAPLTGVDVPGTQAIIDAAIDRGETTLSYDDTTQVLARYGIASPQGALTADASPDEIAELSTRIGYPVVVKSVGRRFGRSAKAGIALDLGSEQAVSDAVGIIRSALGSDANALVVQEMATPGIDVRIHCTTDPRLGPVVTVGPGSLQLATLGDDTSRLPPLSPIAAETMIDASNVAAALAEAHIDGGQLVDAIMRVAQLMFDHPDICEIDINPMIVSSTACLATDARIDVHRDEHQEFALRRLV